MSAKREKRRKLRKKLFTKNRLVVLNEDTFEEMFSLRLTLMNVFVVATIGMVVIITVTTYIIAFTPLREYIPGYASTKLKKEATALALKSDSLMVALQNNDAYIQSVRRVLTDDLDYARLSGDSITAAQGAGTEVSNLQASEEELALRAQVAAEDKYNLFEKASAKVGTVLFPPVRGMITDKYDIRKKHYAVDVAVGKNTAVKAAANGTVIFAEWTPGSGHVIIVRHGDGFLTVYKHCESLTAEQGDVVKTGEVLGIAGTSGAHSTGIHLHFELWKDGYPIDPEQFVSFE